MTLWGGRFSAGPDELLRRLNDSLRYDQRLYRQDIAGSIVYARALARAGVLTQAEADSIIDGLERVRAEFDAGEFIFGPGDEDIHTAVERRLTELIGEVGGKLHTGRSRNDQVATDFRLWTMEAIDTVDANLNALQTALVDKSEPHVETVMPGYTHFQPAQPITVAHWLMSFFWMLARDRERLADARRRTAVLPLGSGALAGTPFPVDRQQMAAELGMNSYSQNSLDSVSDRDFVTETLFTLSMISTHLSRLAEDTIIYTNPALNFISIADQYSTGSSLMPQKRNADPMELTRGRAGRIIGHLTAMLTTIKGTPSGYNKDLQEDKEALLDSTDTLNDLLPIIAAIINTLTIHTDNIQASLSEDILATDLADYLVYKGVPFRKAHHIVGQVVQYAQEQGRPISKTPLPKLRELSDLFDDDVYNVFNFTRSIEQRQTPGGTAPDAVRKQIIEARKLLQ